jgi:uncharacterized membrane protein
VYGRVFSRSGWPASDSGPIEGALAAVVLYACSPIQIDAALTARMYAPGVLLTLVSSWLLLRLMDQPGSWVPVALYVLTAAALAYMHYFGTIAVAAQLIGAWCYQFMRRQSVRSVCLAGLAVGLLWMPWAGVFWWQFTQVREDYWIAPLTDREWAEQFAAWSSGSSQRATMPLLLVLGAVALLGVWQPRRAIHPVWLAQMLLPRYVCLMVYALTGQSIRV